MFVQQIKGRHAGLPLQKKETVDIPRLKAERNNLVYALYGLLPEDITIVEGRK